MTTELRQRLSTIAFVEEVHRAHLNAAIECLRHGQLAFFWMHSRCCDTIAKTLSEGETFPSDSALLTENSTDKNKTTKETKTT